MIDEEDVQQVVHKLREELSQVIGPGNDALICTFVQDTENGTVIFVAEASRDTIDIMQALRNVIATMPEDSAMTRTYFTPGMVQ